MKKLVIAFALICLPTAALAQDAPNFDISEYKTVAVQPVVSASNTPGLFERQMAAAAAQLEFTEAGRSASKSGTARYLAGDGGFGFAGKAQAKDIILFKVASSIGMMPTALRLDATQGKAQAAQIEPLLPKLKGLVSDDVLGQLQATIAAAKGGDLETTARGVLMAMAAATQDITSAESARPHGYVAVGLYAGFATIWATGGKANADYAMLATPLVALLEEDAAMGGADRAMAAQLRNVAAELQAGTPNTENVFKAIAAMNSVKPD